MRFTRKLVLLALLALAVTALAAQAASASEVLTEATGVHCSAITENDAPATPEVAGGCPVKGTATDFELGGAFGVMVTCDITLEGKTNEAGGGIGVGAINAATGGCETGSATPCTGAADAHTTNTPGSSTSPTSGTVTTSFCAIAFSLTNRCANVTATVNEGAGHTYTTSFVHTNKCSNGVNSLQGTITQVIDAAHPKVEVR